jgi:8-oxo-dGTP pyrophosphatase MutT (NUDIX family)
MIRDFKVVVSAVILNDNKQVLLGKRSEEEDVFPGLWGIPGGKVEVEESGMDTIENALKREALEEMGVEIQPKDYLESSCRVVGDSAKLYIIFSAEHIGGTPTALEDTVEVKWADFDSLSPTDLTPHTYENIKQALQLADQL